MPDADSATTRRRVLAGLGAVTTAGVAGCSDRLWSRAENPPPERVSLTIKTVPADDDLIAAKISNQLTENYRAAGIDTAHEPMAEAELYREVLVDGEFDVFVARHPGFDELDAIRPMLHSDSVGEQGWQNPFRFSDPTVDEHLDTQTTESGYTRRATFTELFDYLHDTAPYTAIAFPEHLAAAHSSVAVSNPPRQAMDYIEILSQPLEDGPTDDPFRVGLFGEQQITRLNPIVVDLSEVQKFLGLLYDPLVRNVSNEHIPWLASDVSWEETGSTLVATVSLRDGLTWHDGEPLDAEDVAFTVDFLEDTSLGEVESGVPAFRYRGQQSLIDDVDTVDSTTIRYTFDGPSRNVARRALTVPLLPKHVWEPRSELVGEHRTEALVWDNEEPIGSGLLAFAVSDGAESLVLEPYDEHVLRDERLSELPPNFEEFSQYGGIEVSLLPNSGAAIDSLVDNEIDLIASKIPPEEFDALADEDEITRLNSSTSSFYLVGYNIRHPELGNPRFRSVLSRLIDRTHSATDFFHGYADPATTYSSLVGIVPSEWDHPQTAPLSEFPGEDGEINEEWVQSLFEEAGYRYDDGDLLA